VIHSGNATVQRREERLLRARIQEMDTKVNVLVKEVAKLAPPTPLSPLKSQP
jgi:hypothetical protein